MYFLNQKFKTSHSPIILEFFLDLFSTKNIVQLFDDLNSKNSMETEINTYKCIVYWKVNTMRKSLGIALFLILVIGVLTYLRGGQTQEVEIVENSVEDIKSSNTGESTEEAVELTGEARYQAIIEHLSECGVESIDLPYEIEDRRYSILGDGTGAHGPEYDSTISFIPYTSYYLELADDSDMLRARITVRCEGDTEVRHNNGKVNSITDTTKKFSVEKILGGIRYNYSVYADRLGYHDNSGIYKVIYRKVSGKNLVIDLIINLKNGDADSILNYSKETLPMWFIPDQIASGISLISY